MNFFPVFIEVEKYADDLMLGGFEGSREKMAQVL